MRSKEDGENLSEKIVIKWNEYIPRFGTVTLEPDPEEMDKLCNEDRLGGTGVQVHWMGFTVSFTIFWTT